MMIDELVVSRIDLAALSDQARAVGVALGLMATSRGQAGVRGLIAEVLPASIDPSELRARCIAERLGVIEVCCEASATHAQARLAEWSRDLPDAPLALLSVEPLTAWWWNAAQQSSSTCTGIRLLGGDLQAERPLLERISFNEPRAELALHPRLQRQLLALGEAGQRQLGALTIAVVGCGGTGSMVAHLLALAGIGRLLLIDDDHIEQSNRNRLVCATDDDVRRRVHKVVALQRHLKQITPDVAVVAIPHTLYDQRSTSAILSADMLVGCTDNEGSRLHLNHLAVQHILPYIDCGAGIEPQSAGVRAGGQVRVVLPGGPCLECYGGIDGWHAARDLATPRERALRRAHGYGLGDEHPVPALVFLNASIAAEAAANVVGIATGLRPLHAFLSYDLIGAQLAPRADAQRSFACPTCAPGQRFGRGDSLPLLGPAHDVVLPVAKNTAARKNSASSAETDSA